MRFLVVLMGMGILWGSTVQGAGFLERFGLKKSTVKTNTASTVNAVLSQDEISGGLKQALGNGIERAIASLGQTNGFLQDAAVKIAMPQSLTMVEKSLRKLRQDKLADDFVMTMNRAAEKAVPEAAAVLGDALKNLSIADATTILTGTNNAATQYFRRTSQTNLLDRFLPIVKKATEEAGVTSAYKTMVAKASGGLSSFGKLGGLLGAQAPNLDAYVTQKTLDGLFLKIAEQEKMIRENPRARGTELLEKVFGAVKK